MRVETSVTALSWIPSEALPSGMRLPFDWGVTHYDAPPPDRIEDLDALRQADRFRFANRLSVWAEVEDGRIVSHGRAGGGLIGSTTVRLARRDLVFTAYPLPDLCPEPEVTATSVRFTQTAGGRAGLPFPRPVDEPPHVRLVPPFAWTTVAVTIHADGRTERELCGASTFPRHWVYDEDGHLMHKSAAIDFIAWARRGSAESTPWGGQDSSALMSAAESALERELSRSLMRGRGKPAIRKLRVGEVLVQQHDAGNELFLLLDGVLTVSVDGEPLAEVGPGAILGERALLEGGHRTSTLTAVTRCKVAVVPAADIDPAILTEISTGHRREDEARSS